MKWNGTAVNAYIKLRVIYIVACSKKYMRFQQTVHVMRLSVCVYIRSATVYPLHERLHSWVESSKFWSTFSSVILSLCKWPTACFQKYIMNTITTRDVKTKYKWCNFEFRICYIIFLRILIKNKVRPFVIFGIWNSHELLGLSMQGHETFQAICPSRLRFFTHLVQASSSFM